MLAHAFLTVITARQRPPEPQVISPHTPLPALIPLTRNEIRHLFIQLAHNIRHTAGFMLSWSIWRRRHQQRARQAHWKRRTQTDRDRL